MTIDVLILHSFHIGESDIMCINLGQGLPNSPPNPVLIQNVLLCFSKAFFCYSCLCPGVLSNHLSIDNWAEKKGSIFVIFLVLLIYCSHPRDRLLYGISIAPVVKNVKVHENENSRSFMK